MIRRLLIAILILALLAGCQSVWTRIDAGTAAYKTDHYSVELPVNWVRAESNELVFITRDGISIQRITIEYREHDKAFKKTEQKSTPDMPPSELADRYMAEMRALDENGLPNLEILANRPVTLDRRLGFELHLRFLSSDGLRYERLVNGFANEDGYFAVSYQAPTLHFFERDRNAFDALVKSFHPI